MKTVQVNIYTFEELSPEVQLKVLDRYRYINTDHDWFEYTIELWQEKLEILGFGKCTIAFSGFCSQGDGASFTSNGYEDIKKFIDSNDKFKPLLEHLDYISFSVSRTSHHYSHHNTCTAYVETETAFPSELETLANELAEHINYDRIKLCKELYSDLEKEYEFLMSDEAVKETILANEYMFTSEGKIWHDQ